MAETPPTVQMTHPKVKNDAHVQESAVPILEKSGWKRVKPVNKAAATAPAKNDKEGDG